MSGSFITYLKRSTAVMVLAAGFALWSPTLSAKPQAEEDKETLEKLELFADIFTRCLLYTSPSPRDATLSRMLSSA